MSSDPVGNAKDLSMREQLADGSLADRLEQIAQQLQQHDAAPSVTLREFLSWFGARRRGVWIVSRIRAVLANAGLQTEPDFESAYIDSQVTFRHAVAGSSQTVSPPPGVLAAVGTCSVSVSASASLRPVLVYDEPTYRISKLRAANNPPVVVRPDAHLEEAVTLMLVNEFSQLPVMTSERDVKGVISWASIAPRLALKKDGKHVRDLMDTPQHEIRADASLFQAIPIIVQHQYVLVRGVDNRITGIITASDLSLQFLQLAEPFLLLGEIENQIRRMIGTRFSKEELAGIQDSTDSDREVNGVSDLSFGEYIRLLENPERWRKLDVSIDRATFCRELDQVRGIRNDVMHFDPDGVPTEDLDQLRSFAAFLQRIHGIGVG